MPLLTLPNELLIHLYKQLPDLHAVQALARTCKALYSVVQTHHLAIIVPALRKHIRPWRSAYLLAQLKESKNGSEVNEFYRDDNGKLCTVPSLPAISLARAQEMMTEHRAVTRFAERYETRLKTQPYGRRGKLIITLSVAEKNRLYAAVYLFRLYQYSPTTARTSFFLAHSMLQLLEASEANTFSIVDLSFHQGSIIFGEEANFIGDAVRSFSNSWQKSCQERLNDYDAFGLMFPHEVPLGWKILDAFREEYALDVQRREDKKKGATPPTPSRQQRCTIDHIMRKF